MRKFIILLSSLLMLLAVGCGRGETAVPTQPESATESETDLQTVVSKPQLIEFYADW